MLRIAKRFRLIPIAIKPEMNMHPALKLLLLTTIVPQLLSFTSLADEIPIGHFGNSDYGDWKATGTAFRKGPASGELLTKLEIENASVLLVASSEIEGDGPTGTLISPEF